MVALLLVAMLRNFSSQGGSSLKHDMDRFCETRPRSGEAYVRGCLGGLEASQTRGGGTACLKKLLVRHHFLERRVSTFGKLVLLLRDREPGWWESDNSFEARLQEVEIQAKKGGSAGRLLADSRGLPERTPRRSHTPLFWAGWSRGGPSSLCSQALSSIAILCGLVVSRRLEDVQEIRTASPAYQYAHMRSRRDGVTG